MKELQLLIHRLEEGNLLNQEEEEGCNNGEDEQNQIELNTKEEGNIFNQREEECNNDEDGKYQIEVEEPNKILKDEANHVDSNKKNHLI
uniref:Candidate secreted effector n=1 Tax=Meloidogyne incognita TaxID=6306 RepID=A0A914KPL5_MELIC